MANTSKGKVCVTGASGFVASWLVKRLLESGYHVLGTVRDPGNQKKVAHLWNLAGAKEGLELVRADLLEEGSFDDAVMACEGVFHTASPIITNADSKACYTNYDHFTAHLLFFPILEGKDVLWWWVLIGRHVIPLQSQEEMLDSAINGTLNVLRSCKKNPFLKRVVLTSSSSTVRLRDEAEFPPNVLLDETSWSSVEFCESIQIWYAVAKILAEKSAWEFAKENNIDLVAVLPTFVIGPNLSPVLGPTASDVLGLFKGETEKFTIFGRMGYVHIDDVASCHILVYETADAKGRYICNSAVLDSNELVALLAKRFPSFPIPKSLPNIYGEQTYGYNTSKIRKLGLEFRGVEEMFDDSVESLKAHGYLREGAA
ncbi:Bifunctional dihydroflavonol 4-reductase/flavanone 4-reductase [Triticum urartu]|uniref:Bifunctional dihydroflavonol 4-reductase/flavanone 4-reductase n=2 Tax=Triticum TaxID=4564 RepID=M7Z102_TRIUA|nr:tetraketide alpha-pyrone reductase 1-like isoform X1 [Triticum aestivum]EMS53116.1 Bifunctional dihydroflavonol 4-reductase/flavanone 4-reductase [Triticum urartu]